MARGSSTFKQRDVARAIKAMQAVGIEIARVEIGRDGKLVFVVKSSEPAQPEDDTDKEVAALREEWGEAIRKARL